ncbi:MAG: type I restriction-modification system subunit M [Lachnospiraceae bacterium]|jgi:type I restriction enzyme M protein|nr:type I restriction-modification system subunit M [Lachnospiraceae bacterium]
MNKQQLASKIWEAANQMRSKIEANDYKDYILGFIFYKYLSDTELKFLHKEGWTEEYIASFLNEDDLGTVVYIQQHIGYFISYDNLFSTWLKKGKDFNVSNVRDALSAFSRLIYTERKKVFDRIFDTLQTGLSKLGDSSAVQTKSISELIQLIKVIPMDGKQDYDVLGYIYEYLISNFAANAGKKAGEFYTPHEVSILMSEIVANHVKDRTKIDIYDPTSGSGSLLINIGNSIAKYLDNENNIKYYAQELKANTYNLTRMNLIMRGILPDNIFARNGDTLEDDWPYFDESDPMGTYNPLYVDAVVSNPPYSQAWDPANKESDPRYSDFGLAPKTKADFAFLLHDLYHLKADGIMTIVLPHGVLFRGGEEGIIRKNLIEKNHIDAIIGLPANIFFGTGIPTIIMVLKKKRTTTDVLIIDASKGFAKVGKNNVLRASDIKRIADTVIGRKSIDKYSRLVSQDVIRQNEYNLNIPRYVDSSDVAETWDIYASMFGGIPKAEIALLEEYWRTFDGLKKILFTDNGSPYCELAVDDLENAIKNHPAVVQWSSRFEYAFDDFARMLKTRLLYGWETLGINKEETIIADDIFKRLEEISLIDPYSAYQALDDEWIKIAVDIEILQTEGFAATKKVNPFMVTKKKDGKDHEVQDGWIGHVIPFELVQRGILKTQAELLKEKEERLTSIQASYDEIIEALSEEEKESGVLNESKDSFVAAEIAKKIKEQFGTLAKAKVAIIGLDAEALERKIVQVQEWMDEEKSLKAQIKEDAKVLHLKTKEMIENLTDAEALELLEQKWIHPILTALNKIPSNIISTFISRVKNLTDKYATTYAEVATQILETKNTLAKLMDELTGNEFDMKGLHEFQELLRGEKNA